MELKKIDQIHEELKKLSLEERRITASILKHLMIINNQNAYLAYGHDSILKYCVRELGYSESASYRRIKAMRLMSEIKSSEQKFIDQKLNLTQLCKAQTIFEEVRREEKRTIDIEKKEELLSLIENKSGFESENIIRANLGLVEKRRVIVVKVNEETYQSWIQLKGRVAHKDLSTEGVLSFAIESALGTAKLEEKESHRRSGAKPLKAYGRYIPMRLRQRLLRKAQFKCSYPGCESVYALEVDHIKPMKLGGKTTEDNLRVLCRNHNQYLSKLSA